MSDGSATIDVAELRDEPETVYALGVPRDMEAFEVEEVRRAFKYNFNHARFVTITLPIEGTVAIEEIDARDLFDEEEYKAIMEDHDGEA